MNTVFALIVDDAQQSGEPDIRSVPPDLTTLQTLVDGSIEAVYGYPQIDGTVPHQPRITFYLNDEGKLRGLPPNPLVTALWSGGRSTPSASSCSKAARRLRALRADGPRRDNRAYPAAG